VDLLERQPQLEELAQHLRAAAAGTGKIVFVSGEAGAGKSAVVEMFAQQAPRGTRLLWGHCDALQTSRVLGPVHEVASGLSLAQTSRAESNSREPLFGQLLERLSPPHPVSLVVLEDIHWADEATLDFVRFLGRRIQRTRCLLIATHRDDELPSTHPLRAVLGELIGQHAARLRIPPLSLDAVEQLLRGTRHDARHIYQVTEGNAFFVRELLAAQPGTVPETVRDAVLARLMACSVDARALTELVSLLPGRTPSWLTHTLLGDVGTAADEAVAHGLLRYHEDALGFRHELGRLAVEGAVPRARARELHGAILRALAVHDADLSQLVHHASHAQDVPALLQYAPQAAERAALAGAHREAVAHLATALRHADSLSAPERARLLERHALGCNMTNEVATAIASAHAALALWKELGDVTAQARVQLLLAQQYWKAGQKNLVDQHVNRAIELLETLPPSPELAMAYSNRSRFAMTAHDSEEAVRYGERALDLAERFGDHSVCAHALTNIGAALLSTGDVTALQKLERGLAVALEHGLSEHAGRAYANLVELAVSQRRPELAERYLATSVDYCETHEVQDCLSYNRAYGAYFELNSGHWDEAARMATELIEYRALAAAQRIPALTVLAVVRARRGDPGVDALLDEALQLASPTCEIARIGPVAAARAELAWYRGDRERVAHEAAIGLEAARGCGDAWIYGELLWWATRADPELQPPAPLAEPYELMIAGDWAGAARIWKQLGMPYERAVALAQGPEAALRESLALLETLGAGPLAAIVRQRLRELGVHSIPRGPRASTRANPAGLTAREIQVLKLLVQGHTNSELADRLHVATKTVDHHMSSILAKLEVRSRTEAVSAAFGLGICKAPDGTGGQRPPG
jgi:DNA-binding CsgD family transcriptional regulator/tetratricopeptide (TPR) repeat protein